MNDQKRRGSGLKLTNQNSVIEPPKPSDKQVFDKAADKAFGRHEEYKNRTLELSGQLKNLMQDKTLPENKSPITSDLEKEVLNKLVVLALDIEQDDSQPGGFGPVALCRLLMSILLAQRDQLNTIGYKLEQVEKKLAPK